MAPTFRHGKGIRTLIGSRDFSKFLHDFTISASMDAAEVTTFQLNDRAYIGGLKDVTASFEGLFAASSVSPSTDDIADFMAAALGGSSQLPVTIDLQGTTGGRALMMTGDLVTYDISSPVDDAVSLSVDIQGSNGYRGGRMLRPNVASTSTGSQSAVLTAGTTAAGGTTSGGVGYLHVTSVASTFGSATFKIQHSTSGSSWADLITFTAATGIRSQRSTVAGTVKEQLRSTLSSYTSAGTSDTITASISFSRNGRSI